LQISANHVFKKKFELKKNRKIFRKIYFSKLFWLSIIKLLTFTTIYKTGGSALQISANHVFKKKKFELKKLKKKIGIFSVKFIFPNFFGYQCSAANLGYACEIFGGLGQLV
jgi:hypothetical protein